ncbi:MAG TPA: large-conductance mechanosensitive channel protein MscL [Phenylobacterium sp.]
MSIVSEFKEFIARGNVIDLAVGVIIGAAFNNIIKSLVDQVIMPPIGWIAGGIDFSRYQWVLREDNPATKAVETVAIQYGAFLNTVVQFVIVAWAVFLLVKMINFIHREQDAAAGAEGKPTLTPTDTLLTEIRDLLRAQQGLGAATPPGEPAPRKGK